MNLTPREKDKLLIAMAASVARRRLERGLRLNHPEAVALIADFVLEGARDGRSVLTRADVMDGIAEMIPDIQVEASFPDGTKLVTVHEPIRDAAPAERAVAAARKPAAKSKAAGKPGPKAAAQPSGAGKRRPAGRTKVARR